MAYALYSAVYDITLRNSDVVITNKFTGVPAVVMQSPDSGTINSQGLAKLDDQARLNVYIDTAQEWNIKVLSGQVLPYNVLDPKQIVTIQELQSLVPQIGKTYVLSQPPYTEYTYDGVRLVPSLSAEQTLLLQSMSNTSLSNVVFRNDGKIISYIKDNIQHMITYPDANTIIISNDTGASKVITIDGQGKVSDISIN